jgi:hypothetical protein
MLSLPTAVNLSGRKQQRKRIWKRKTGTRLECHLFVCRKVLFVGFSSAKKKHKKEKKARRDKDSDYEERKATPPPEVPKNEPENISSVKPEDLPEVPTTNKFLMRRRVIIIYFIFKKKTYPFSDPRHQKAAGPINRCAVPTLCR